jgi:uncharacterized repeat protein (TIGR01451 family)
MFEKLLSSLPFNPGAVEQIAFYAKRVRSEQAIRRVGLVFIVLAFLVQFFAFASPPQSTSADSPNDLVNGGFSSAAEAASDCQSNVGGYGTMLSYYGITCSDVASANTLTINSYAWNRNLWSMGRLNYNLAGEAPVTIPGLGYPIYDRYLWAWDSAGTSSNYQVLNVTVAGGQTFLLMYQCGNIVSVGQPQPVQQKPNITISKTTKTGYPVANSTVQPGTNLGFTIYWNNLGGPATNVNVEDPQPLNTTENFLSPSTSTSSSFVGQVAFWDFASMPAGANNWYVDVGFKVNANTPNGTKICNFATVNSAQTATIRSNSVCVTVQSHSPPPKKTTPPPKKTTPPPKKKTTPPPCEEQLSSEAPSTCISISKSASNLTENIANANDTTAKAGDEIQYTLNAKNIGSNDVKNYVFDDNLSYVLDYSSLTDAYGGSLKSDDDITWPAVNIKPNQTITKQFDVRVDNPIPQTPTSSSDPEYFNLKMTNTYGNTITINLPTTPVAVIQNTSSTLPNTGPGSGIIIGAIIVAVAGFFFYRSRLLAIESRIAISSQSGDI